ncbi:MAG: 23S rRNA (guanosine(2251)-2'-O)-methyltransferase RlmB [Oscillospiraceae bacterium]
MNDYNKRKNDRCGTPSRGNNEPRQRKSHYSDDDQRRYDRRKSFEHDEEYSRDKGFSRRYDDDEASEDNGLIIGRNPVIEALKADKPIDTLFVNADAGGSIGMISRMARDKGIVIKQVSDQKLTAMSRGASHQGCIAVGACAEYVSVEDILNISKQKGTEPFIIICDEIEDPHNLGAIIRTAEAAGADGVIIPKRRSASLNFTVNKTSAGAASWVPVARVPNLGAAIDQLKENGVWIYGTDASGEGYTEVSMTGAVGLVIGSEGFGMGRLIREKCDYLLSLPMNGKITSLNASVAAGIFMYEAVRQRNAVKK